MTYLQITYNDTQYRIDLSDNDYIALNKKLSDVKDISKRGGDFSKTITILGSKEINKIFSHSYDIRVIDGNFDRTKRIFGILVQDDEVVMEGFLRLLSINTKHISQNIFEQEVSYECSFYNTTSEFFSKLQGKLSDNDYRDLNHIWDWDNILDIQTKPRNPYMYFFPTPFSINMGVGNFNVRSFYSEDNSSNMDYDLLFSINQMYPSVNIYTYLDKIFKKYEFEWEFEEATSFNFDLKSIYIPHNLKKRPVSAENDFFTPFSNTSVDNGTIGVTPRPLLVPVVEYGSTINVQAMIPDIGEREFIQSIFTIYNLYVEVDEETPNKLIIKSRDKYYREGTKRDWNTKLDYSEPVNVSFFSDEYGAKETNFNFTEGGNFIVQDLIRPFSRLSPASGFFEVDNEHLKGSKDVNILFNPYMPFVFGYTFPTYVEEFFPLSITQFFREDFAIDFIDGEEATEDNFYVSTAPAVFPNPENPPRKIFLTTFQAAFRRDDDSDTIYNNPNGDFDYDLLIDNGQLIEIDELVYRRPIQILNYSDTGRNGMLLAFDNYNLYNAITNIETPKNFINTFYLNTLRRIQNGKILEGYFKLTPEEFKQLRLSDNIILNKVGYNILQVKDYNASKNQTTEVKLITDDVYNTGIINEDEFQDSLIDRYVLDFNGNSYTENDNSTPFASTSANQAMTIYARVRGYSGQGRNVLFDTGDVSDGKNGYNATLFSNGVRFRVRGNNSTNTLTDILDVQVNITLQSDFDLHITYDGSKLASGVQMYINGIPYSQTIASDILNNYIGNSTGSIRFGGSRDGSDFNLEGGIEDFSIVNQVKSLNQIQNDVQLGTQVLNIGQQWILAPVKHINPDFIDLAVDNFPSVDKIINIFGKTYPMDLNTDFIIV